MTAALRAQLDAIGEKAVEDALDTLRREHQERQLDGRVLDVVTQTMQAAWAARNRLSNMTAGRRESDGPPPPVRHVTTPASAVFNCPVCCGLGCGECCQTGRA